jgi:hypothetical protein
MQKIKSKRGEGTRTRAVPAVLLTGNYLGNLLGNQRKRNQKPAKLSPSQLRGAYFSSSQMAFQCDRMRSLHLFQNRKSGCFEVFF